MSPSICPAESSIPVPAAGAGTKGRGGGGDKSSGIELYTVSTRTVAPKSSKKESTNSLCISDFEIGACFHQLCHYSGMPPACSVQQRSPANFISHINISACG